MKKQCFKCHMSKPLGEFYHHSQMADGHLNKCKDCTKKDVRRRYYDPATRQSIIDYERARAKTPHRKASALTYQRTRRKRNPQKDRARAFINNSLRKGTITRKPCQKCGNENSEAHHTDYSKPLSVIWLCRKHHMREEGKRPFLTCYNKNGAPE